ncbi:3-dehydroquinate synthase [Pseudopedobacter saltans DSM 12145]|uniref:3-dehydroquinate synthase n=1 Tax=Pseudopedobacter saltans (strain ATCC 51119 / DSM 12145 / JCM 21818 / CCUG 39354 / LMG 10337 / NBRC 100064 / NCIMB 13643) TaxID=762903 RepID=F0SD13_PSESL|nr:3-dehydroquinate synthase [Pseudopedobacter saltans]ADY51770.1 3-dehydroquinate synthase [Pseudopedobacter saltans DSM 12145]
MNQLISSGYNIYFDNTLSSLETFLAENSYSKIFIVTDENTGEHCLPLLQKKLPKLDHFDIIEIPHGEENKNIDFCIGIWKMLLDFEADRNALVINLGGGVVTDMGSFAASTYKRGIDFLQIPTTLLSQVDASVGGKTGIDIDNVKNIIGTFSQPKAVIICNEFLDTLPDRQVTSGFAEVIKHGIIADKKYYEEIIKLSSPKDITIEQIQHSIEIKNKVVLEDPFEKGLRKILNFGHTIGHAVESWSLENDNTPLTHGEAIAIGMITEAYISNKIDMLSDDNLNTIKSDILKFFPKYNLRSDIYDTLLEVMQHDKKNISGKINFSLPDEIGNCKFNIVVDQQLIKDSLDFYRSL